VSNTEKKEVKRSRDVAVTFRVTQSEYDLIKKGMKESGVNNMRAYLLKMAVNGQIFHVELDGVRDMVRLLSNATNNLNQIARRVNGGGSLYAADVADLRERYDGLWEQAKAILRELASNV
jgi:hypothetical protein